MICSFMSFACFSVAIFIFVLGKSPLFVMSYCSVVYVSNVWNQFLGIFTLYMVFLSYRIYFFYIFIGVYLLHNVVLVSVVQQSESAISIHISPYPLPPEPPSHPPYPTPLGGHKAPTWSPCAMQQLPTSHPFYIW